MLRVFVLLLCTSVLAYRPQCDKRSVLRSLRRPTYDFSVRILDRVAQETDGHFVFSPISTWLQLLALADGAQGKTRTEILKVTRYRRIVCFRTLVRKMFNVLDNELSAITKRRSIIAIDKVLDVKKSFKTKVEKLNAAKVMSLNFNNVNESADRVNQIIKMDTNGVIKDSLYADDFNMSVLLMTDTAYMKADWRRPFNPAETKSEPFYSDDKIFQGHVNMMHQIGYFNLTEVPGIGAKALELPFNERVSMILILPSNGLAIDLFWSLKDVKLMNIFSLFKSDRPKLVNLKMPRFKVTTDIDNVPELLDDMGVRRIFNARADFRSISKYRVFVSMMTSVTDIEVTEKGVSGNVGPEFLIVPENSTEMFFNRPFAYLIVDRITNVILFAGIYSEPSLY